MSKYTTGEVAKRCGVSVRTVQYYDTRGILTPSELSEGGRRLYSQEDLKKMEIICFLRDAGLPINAIGELLREEDPGRVISVLLERQEQALLEEIKERQARLELLGGIRRALRSVPNFSLESIRDIAHQMENKREMKRFRAVLLLTGIPVSLFQWGSILYGIMTGKWRPFALYLLLAVPYAAWVTRFYFSRVAYVCPQCHEVFRPRLKEAFWARHTPTLRKLTCTRCGYKGFCVEIYRRNQQQNG